MTAPSSIAWLPALREPQQVLSWSLAEWQVILRQARRLRLAGRLAWAISDAGLMNEAPLPARRLLRAEWNLSDARCTALTWAVDCIGRALRNSGVEPVLLKGAAYIVDGIALGRGRLPSDLDIMVSKDQLSQVERALMEADWSCIELDVADAHYYRAWSHELPPMRHHDHTLELDLHHNILPPRKGRWIDADALLRSARPAGLPSWRVLSPEDQILHSAAHLFWDPEPLERVRDLVDIDGLMRAAPESAHLSPEAFADRIQARARQLRLEEPLALAVCCCAQWFRTPLPGHLIEDSRRRLSSRIWLPVFQFLLEPAPVEGARPWRQRASSQLVLARYHWNRMPLRQLVPHLTRKLSMRVGRSSSTPN